MSRRIDIDFDLWVATGEYVDKQIAVMHKYGNGPIAEWGDEMRDYTIYAVAVYPQKLRNLVNKSKPKEALRIHEPESYPTNLRGYVFVEHVGEMFYLASDVRAKIAELERQLSVANQTAAEAASVADGLAKELEALR